MKRFAYAVLILFILSLSFHLGARIGSASSGQVIALGQIGEFTTLVLDTGMIAAWSPGTGWTQVTPVQLPFPASQLAFYTGYDAVDLAENLWVIQGSAWELIGPPPGTTAIPEGQIKPSTWGQIKTRAGG